MSLWKSYMRLAMIVGATMLGTSGCSTAGREWAAVDTTDPFEAVNRNIFDFNLIVYDNVLTPVSSVYRAAIPQYGRDRLKDFLGNLRQPVIFANDILQLRFDDAILTSGRFFINSTFGVAGFFDVATAFNENSWYKQKSGDFGQTLFVWGIPSGPYVVLPVFGPSNPRDLVGDAVESYFDPFSLLAAGNGTIGAAASAGRGFFGSIDGFDRNLDGLNQLRRDSFDLYARLRSVVLQQRAHQLGVTLPEDTGFPEDPAAQGAPTLSPR